MRILPTAELKIELQPGFEVDLLESKLSWESLLGHMRSLVALREDEEITGLIVNENGIVVKLRQNNNHKIEEA